MAVKFDHMYVSCGDGGKVTSDLNLEIQVLKDMLIFHLDLIQEQNDKLYAKDKQIKSLREENEHLRSRLERIERRLSLSHQKKGIDSFTKDAATESLPIEVSELSPAAINTAECKSPERTEVLPKRSPRTLSPRVSPRERRPKPDLDLKDTETLLKLDSPKSPESRRSRYSSKRTPETSPEGSAKKIRVLEKESPPAVPDENITDHSLRSRDKQKESHLENEKYDSLPTPLPTPLIVEIPPESTTDTVLSQPRKLRQKSLLKNNEGKVLKEENILTTTHSYFLPRNSSALEISDTSNDFLNSVVEIPRWRTKILTSLYVMEGTENLEDEIFIKRHSKPESDEKRRKRWDLQRMREQRQYEKLRERYECRNNLSDPRSFKQSLWPSPEMAQMIAIDEQLPVCAFGQPLCQIPPVEFSLPWMINMKSPGGNLSDRRRRR